MEWFWQAHPTGCVLMSPDKNAAVEVLRQMGAHDTQNLEKNVCGASRSRFENNT